MLVAGFTWLNLRSILLALQATVNTSQRLGQYDLREPIACEGRDEATALMQGLKHMQGSLREVVSGVRQATAGIATASREVAAGSLDLSQRTEQAALLTSQGAAVSYEPVNMHTAPDRNSPSFFQFREGVRVEVLGGVGQERHDLLCVGVADRGAPIRQKDDHVRAVAFVGAQGEGFLEGVLHLIDAMGLDDGGDQMCHEGPPQFLGADAPGVYDVDAP